MSKTALAIDLGGTNVRAALVDSQGHILIKKTLPTQAGDGSQQILRRIIEVSQSVLAEAELPVAIGMGSPGCVDSDRGIVLFATDNLPGWRGTDLKGALEKELSLRAYIDNDVNMMAYGESRIGAGTGVSALVCLTLGTGVGGAVILNGKIYRGQQYYAGELGHISINREGPFCNCGGRGCLESYIGTAALIKQVEDLRKDKIDSGIFHYAEKNEGKITPEIIFKAAQDKDPSAQAILKEMGHCLGFALAMVVNVLSPERIVIGGGISRAWDYFYPSLMESLRRQSLFGPERNVEVVMAELGPDAGLAGSGLYALEQAGY